MTRLPFPIAALLLLSACTPEHFETPGPITDATTYDALFPRYMEYCAVSQIRKKPGSGPYISGGPGGHAVVFLGGACLDHSTPYPVLKACTPQDHTDGVGLSVNAHYSNANWAGVEGRDFFFNGTLKPGQPLTPEIYRQTQEEAKRRGIFDGITFHDYVFDNQPPTATKRDWKYEMSVSTDYAVDFGRGRFCTRIPVTEPQMSRVITYLNSRNAPYRDGKKQFRWSVFNNNCTHLMHNALSVAGMWSPWPTERSLLIAIFSFPVPKNEYVNLLKGAEHDLTNLPALYRNTSLRTALLQDDWMPDEPGLMNESAPPRTPNALYNTSVSLIFYDDPILGRYTSAFETIRHTPHYHDLRANLAFYAQLYDRVTTARKPLDWWQKTHPALNTRDFATFYTRFYSYIETQNATVTADLQRLAAPATPADNMPP